MRIIAMARYCMVATGHVAANGESGPVNGLEISKTYGLPYQTLRKALQQLIRANILRGKRGSYGGYMLARPANEITMLEIIEAAQGPVEEGVDTTELTQDTPITMNAEQVYFEAVAKVKDILLKAKLSKMIS